MSGAAQSASTLSRRQLLRGLARAGLLAGLLLGGGWLVQRAPAGKSTTCPAAARCGSCRSLAGCRQPAALEARQNLDQGRGRRG